MKNSAHGQLTKVIEQIEKGSLVFPADFRGLAEDTTINMILSRLQKEGKLTRLAHGIYMVPRYHELIGEIFPPLDEIAQAIALRDHARITPTGSYALHQLGLSTQVPLNVVYLTDGTPRNIKVGKGSIRFIKTTPKKLLLKGDISRLAIQALDALKPENVSENMVTHLKNMLKKETMENIRHDFSLAPAWIRQLLIDYKDLKPDNDALINPDRRGA